MTPSFHQKLFRQINVALASLIFLAKVQTTTAQPATNAPAPDQLLLIDHFGNAAAASTNEVSQSLYPSAATDLRNQIPITHAGTPQPESVRRRIFQSKTDREWFPSTPPVLMPYLAGLDELGNTDLQPGALFSNDPLSKYPQAAKYWLSDCGLRYSFNQALAFLCMSDTVSGNNTLGYYTASLFGKWAINEVPNAGRATWLSCQANVQLGLSHSSANQLPQSNLGVIANPNANIYGPNGIWIQELALQQSLLDGKLVLLAGQVNQGNYFDANTYGQFLNFAFNKNCVLPLPYNNLGLNLQFQPSKNWYVMFGTGALNQDAGQSPFHELSFENWSYLLELGLTPEDFLGLGPGAYRLQPYLATFNGVTQPGIGLNIQQRLGNNSHFGWFGRLGVGGSHVTVDGAEAQASTGLALQGPLKFIGLCPKLSNDFLGAGFVWSRAAANRQPVVHSNEYGFEVTYVLQLTPLVSVQPDFQTIWNPANNPASCSLITQLQINVTW